MDSFDSLFERAEFFKKPSGNGRNKSIVKHLVTKEFNKIKDSEFYKKFPERANKYLDDYKKKKESEFFRSKVSDTDYVKIFTIQGFSFYIKKDDKILNTPKIIDIERKLKISMREFFQAVKGILPIRKPKIVLKDINEKFGYGKETPPAYYLERIIYLDYYYIDDPDYIIHEYAHYVADLISAQSSQILAEEYKKLLDEYFQHAKKRRPRSFEGREYKSLEKRREAIARKLGFPSPYAFVNPDELFAEIITYWKKIPNNAITYRFKKIAKKVIDRL